ncbi:MAG: hypothetical protein SPD80_03495 [Atopobium sp.]|uniref:hypothetical protein n=1 Tax=Atopobium sp. TaxID=1872650 RepID=UPI002A827286|nr:hypothetical protein [Atopobium sp.]MDY4522642.1 hypothetical protein [Atopobium sp.]
MVYKRRDTKIHPDITNPDQNHIVTTGELMVGLLTTDLSVGLSDTQKAYRAWFGANGKFEQTHTCGIFLKDMAAQNRLPILYVYIDNPGILQDFTTNKEIYLVRLAHFGFEVSDIQFKLSRYPKRHKADDSEKKQLSPEGPLQEVTQEQKNKANELTKHLSEPLKTKVYDAIISSMRRQMSKDSLG